MIIKGLVREITVPGTHSFLVWDTRCCFFDHIVYSALNMIERIGIPLLDLELIPIAQEVDFAHTLGTKVSEAQQESISVYFMGV